jgi:hypothetical protein
MKRVAISIGLILLFLILCQTTIMSFHLINQPDTFSLGAGLILFGSQIFGIITLVNYTYNLISSWNNQPEILPEEIPTEEVQTKTPEKKKKSKKETNLKPKKDE